jgi:hypothetical protein
MIEVSRFKISNCNSSAKMCIRFSRIGQAEWANFGWAKVRIGVGRMGEWATFVPLCSYDDDGDEYKGRTNNN